MISDGCDWHRHREIIVYVNVSVYREIRREN